ncbi:MAG: hypothetical protein RLZZ505_1312 [Verrucomicrobiota bacterium]|jgi:hypothetical protein
MVAVYCFATAMKSSTVFLVVFGLVTAAIGALFTSLMWDSFQRASAMHAWPKAQAVILSSEIEERRHDEYSAREYRVNLLYGYEWQGKAMTGGLLNARGNPWSKERARPEKELEKFPAGMKTSVYVNPSDPDFSVLKPDSKAAGYSIWFPLLFVAGGLGIAFKAVRTEAACRG